MHVLSEWISSDATCVLPGLMGDMLDAIFSHFSCLNNSGNDPDPVAKYLHHNPVSSYTHPPTTLSPLPPASTPFPSCGFN